MINYVFLALTFLFLIKIKAFDFMGAIVAVLFGFLIWELRGFAWFFILFIYLFVALVATYAGVKMRKNKNQTSREVDNVVSNGLIPLITAVFASSHIDAFLYVYLGSIAAALSDTLGTEIGMLSKNKPFLITNPWKKVTPGTNGGISSIGILASLLGSLIISLSAFYFFTLDFSSSLAVFVGGVLGSTSDSLLGVFFENKKIMTNGSVNFVSTLAGGLVAYLLVLIF